MTTENYYTQVPQDYDITYDDEHAQVSGALSQSGTSHLVITNDGTTIASITIQRSSSEDDGDDGLDKD